MNRMVRACFQIFLGLLACLPMLAFSDTAISLTPQPSDLSIVFLRDIFGTVDGVLAGGGSQILGNMFSLFNAAVLALSGIIVTYTILMATINTASEGEVLGKNMSTIWVPVRTTLGLCLSFTYASGYSVLQIFFMWIVVQGVGAGDLIWSSALNYLQTGGVIVQPIMDSEGSMTAGSTSNSNSPILIGGSSALEGAACMLALQKQLNTLQTLYQSNQQTGASPNPCGPLQTQIASSGISSLSTNQQQMWALCSEPVPDLAGSVDILGAQTLFTQTWKSEHCQCQNTTTQQSRQSATVSCNVSTSSTVQDQDVPVGADCYSSTVSTYMPNLPSNSLYAGLNGICGKLVYGSIQSDFASLMSSGGTLTPADMAGLAENTSSARGVGVQQMFSDMSLVAQAMVNNNATLLGTTSSCTGGNGSCYLSSDANYIATSPFGVPASTAASNATTCLGYYTGTGAYTQSPSCTQWASPVSGFAPLFNGAELQNAVSDYNTILEAPLNLMNNYSTIAAVTSFVGTAESQGWIMAGSYLYNLALVNLASADAQLTDKNSNLGSSQAPPTLGASSNFCDNSATPSTGASNILCTWYNANATAPSSQSSYNAQINEFFLGPTSSSDGVFLSTPNSSMSAGPGPTWVQITPSASGLDATVYGYINNSSNVVMPDQPGLAPPSFAFQFGNSSLFNLGSLPQPCKGKGFMKIPRDVCKDTVGFLWKMTIGFIELVISLVISTFEIIFLIPVVIFDAMLNTAAQMLTSPTVSPLITIAQVGNFFMTTSVDVSITLGFVSAIASLTVAGGIAIAIFMLFLGPLLISWIGMIFSMGVEAAYFIPFTPYVIFTFASFGWMVGVLEAMIAAPLVSLGVCLPEGGHDVFGKGLDSLYLILSAFLRPSLMIISYIAGFILSSVGVWLINTGFGQYQTTFVQVALSNSSIGGVNGGIATLFSETFFFGIYFTMCTGVITRSFELIYKLPDAIMKWIGGSHSTLMGAEMVGDVVSQVGSRLKEFGDATQEGVGATADGITSLLGKNKDKKDGGANINAASGSTPPAGGGAV